MPGHHGRSIRRDEPGPDRARRPDIPVVSDFLRAAAEQFRFVPQPPESELAFKQAYVRVGLGRRLTRDQIVRVYAFETGATAPMTSRPGLTHPKPGSRAISPPSATHQLLSTNSVSLLAEHGDQFVKTLRRMSSELSGDRKARWSRRSRRCGG